MELTSDDVLEIMKFLEDSSFTELRLEMGSLKLVIRKGNKRAWIAEDESRAAEAPAGLTPGKPAPVSQKIGGGTHPAFSPPAKTLPVVESEKEGACLPIKAPMLGTFYRTPKPGSPPFVEVGQMVVEDDPVGIIEVMKLFNTVKAGVRGRIAKVCVEQGQMVEFQQPLFLVEKA
jgi:acetyl-CoA carboxylase biotin carboxyl carrier protein